MQLRVRSITYLAEAINGYELVDPRGRDLPRFAPGAHIEVRAGGFLRRYSLWNDAAERRRYCIAVLREDASRGGSRYLHENVRVGDIVEVSTPRNDFPLDPAAERHLLIAGGIGIAPIMSMVTELRRRGAEFEVHYCTRSPERTAFRRELAPLAAEGRLRFHHDGGDPARGLDIAATVARTAAGDSSLLLRTGAADGGGGGGGTALAGRHRALRILHRGAGAGCRGGPAVSRATGKNRRRLRSARRRDDRRGAAAPRRHRSEPPANSAIAGRA